MPLNELLIDFLLQTTITRKFVKKIAQVGGGRVYRIGNFNDLRGLLR